MLIYQALEKVDGIAEDFTWECFKETLLGKKGVTLLNRKSLERSRSSFNNWSLYSLIGWKAAAPDCWCWLWNVETWWLDVIRSKLYSAINNRFPRSFLGVYLLIGPGTFSVAGAVHETTLVGDWGNLCMAGIVVGETYPERIVDDLKTKRKKSLESVLSMRRQSQNYKDYRGYDLIELPSRRKTVVFAKKEYWIDCSRNALTDKEKATKQPSKAPQNETPADVRLQEFVRK
jgi:hypothetical protein